MNQHRMYRLLGIAAVCLTAPLPARAAGALPLQCPKDSVKVGDVCIDTCEASVGQIPPSNTQLVKLVQAGTTLLDMTGGAASQISGCPSDEPAATPFPASFPRNGQ
jgi:hypothetical protein